MLLMCDCTLGIMAGIHCYCYKSPRASRTVVFVLDTLLIFYFFVNVSSFGIMLDVII